MSRTDRQQANTMARTVDCRQTATKLTVRFDARAASDMVVDGGQ
jgi:hypothetical protein